MQRERDKETAIYKQWVIKFRRHCTNSSAKHRRHHHVFPELVYSLFIHGDVSPWLLRQNIKDSSTADNDDTVRQHV